MARDTCSYHPGPLERATLILRALRQRFLRRGMLVAGPYTGELGYELRFRGLVRAMRDKYGKTYVITYPGREILYPGCRVIAHDIPLEKAGYGVTGRFSPRTHREMARKLLPELDPSDYDLFVPELTRLPFGRWLWQPQEEVITAPFDPEDKTDLLLHFRAVRKEGWDKRRNFEGAEADQLWAACVSLGLKCACIGHPAYAYCPPGCTDFRTEDLARTVAKISATKLVVGQQSGGVHLANYCGKPTLIWASSRRAIQHGLRLNPLKVPITVVTDTTFEPPVEMIVAKLKEFLPMPQSP